MVKPMQRTITTTTTVDVSYLDLQRGHFITIADGEGHSVEVVRKNDGTFQVCVDDTTLEAGIHRFEDIYGPDPI